MQRNSTIGELMERKRIQDGAKEYQGHTYMDLARFDDATKHMIIFDVLTDESPVGWKGERNRLYLSDVGYERCPISWARIPSIISSESKSNPSVMHSVCLPRANAFGAGSWIIFTFTFLGQYDVFSFALSKTY